MKTVTGIISFIKSKRGFLPALSVLPIVGNPEG